jgi:hypothetical protein
MGRTVVKLRRCAAALLAAAAVAVSAQAAAPGPLAKAVNAWAAVATRAQSTGVVPTARRVQGMLDSSASGCEASPSLRGPLAAVVTEYATSLETDVATTHRGVPKLYSLASRLGARTRARRKAYVALLNSARTLVDEQRSQADVVAAAAGLVSAGKCTRAASGVDAAAQAIRLEHASLKTTIAALRTQFG